MSSVRVPLPEGARAVAMDGTDRYTAGPGDTVRVSPGQVGTIRRFARSGPTRGRQFAFGTKRGRACRPCSRVWNAWSATCPRCGAETGAETDAT